MADYEKTIGDDDMEEDFTTMGAHVHDWTTLHVDLNPTVRINSNRRHDGPVHVKAEFAGDQGIHAVQVVFGVNHWHAEAFLTNADARALRDQLTLAIREMEFSEMLAAEPALMRKWEANPGLAKEWAKKRPLTQAL